MKVAGSAKSKLVTTRTRLRTASWPSKGSGPNSKIGKPFFRISLGKSDPLISIMAGMISCWQLETRAAAPRKAPVAREL